MSNKSYHLALLKMWCSSCFCLLLAAGCTDQRTTPNNCSALAQRAASEAQQSYYHAGFLAWYEKPENTAEGRNLRCPAYISSLETEQDQASFVLSMAFHCASDIAVSFALLDEREAVREAEKRGSRAASDEGLDLISGRSEEDQKYYGRLYLKLEEGHNQEFLKLHIEGVHAPYLYNLKNVYAKMLKKDCTEGDDRRRRECLMQQENGWLIERGLWEELKRGIPEGAHPMFARFIFTNLARIRVSFSSTQAINDHLSRLMKFEKPSESHDRFLGIEEAHGVSIAKWNDEMEQLGAAITLKPEDTQITELKGRIAAIRELRYSIGVTWDQIRSGLFTKLPSKFIVKGEYYSRIQMLYNTSSIEDNLNVMAEDISHTRDQERSARQQQAPPPPHHPIFFGEVDPTPAAPDFGYKAWAAEISKDDQRPLEGALLLLDGIPIAAFHSKSSNPAFTGHGQFPAAPPTPHKISFEGSPNVMKIELPVPGSTEEEAEPSISAEESARVAELQKQVADQKKQIKEARSEIQRLTQDQVQDNQRVQQLKTELKDLQENFGRMSEHLNKTIRQLNQARADNAERRQSADATTEQNSSADPCQG